LELPVADDLMPLTKIDKEWVQQQIEDSHKKHGWRKVVDGIKSWSPLGALVAIGLFVIVQWNQSTVDRVHTEDRLTNTETRLTHIEASLASLQISQLGNSAGDKKSQEEAKQLLKIAKTKAILLPDKVVEQAGKSFVEAAANPNLSPERKQSAWETAIDFLNYRSFRDFDVAASFNQMEGEQTLTTKYSAEAPPGLPRPKVGVVGAVPIKQAAILEHIAQHINTGALGNQFVVVDGGNIVLDGFHLKHVVLRNVHVVYSGGPVILEDVYFLNCTFDIKPAPNGQNFASNLLESGVAINFRST